MDVFSLVAKLTLDSSEYDSNLDKAKENAGGFGGALKKSLAVAGAAITAATGAVTAFAKSSIDAGLSFDATMSEVSAISGATGDNFDALREKAQEMGAATKFSATESAEALTYMAMAGWKTEDMLNGIEGIMNLAAAAGEGLATTSDIVTDALTAFGLTAADSGHFADVLAAASSNANTNVSMLGESFKYVAPVAGALGYSAEDVSIALGLMANSGIKASQAGTSLRGTLSNLANPGKNAAAAMQDLGISLTDDSGEMFSLQEIMGQLRDSFGNLTEAEKAEKASLLAGKEAMSGLLAIVNASEEDYAKLTAEIYRADGAAQQMAATMQDNLAGDITIFKSALEGAQIVLSDELTPTLREFVQFGTSAISTLSTAFKDGGLSGAMDALGTVLSDGLAMIMSELPTFVDAGVRLLSSLGDGIIQNLPLMVDAALQIIVSLANGISENLPELIPTIVDVVLQIVDTLTQPDTLSALIDASLAIILALTAGLIDALPRLIDAVPVIIENLVTSIANNLPQIIAAGLELTVKLAEGVAKGAAQLASKAPELILTLINGIVSYWGNLLTTGKEIVDQVKNGFSQKITDAKNWGKDLLQNFIDGIKAKIQALKDTVKSVANTVKNFLGFSEPEEGPLSDFHTYAPDMMKLFAKGIRDNEKLVTDQIEKSFDFGARTIDFATGATGRTVNGAAGAYGAAAQQITIVVQSVLDGRVIGETAYKYAQGKARVVGA